MKRTIIFALALALTGPAYAGGKGQQPQPQPQKPTTLVAAIAAAKARASANANATGGSVKNSGNSWNKNTNIAHGGAGGAGGNASAVANGGAGGNASANNRLSNVINFESSAPSVSVVGSSGGRGTWHAGVSASWLGGGGGAVFGGTERYAKNIDEAQFIAGTFGRNAAFAYYSEVNPRFAKAMKGKTFIYKKAVVKRHKKRCACK